MKTSGNTIFIAGATSGRGSVPVPPMTGTADPLSSHDGGEVSLFGFPARRRVLSAHEAARFFLHVTGSSPLRSPPSVPHREGSGVRRCRRVRTTALVL
jgi:poly(3-hydroxybutyrate) depolymerase